MRPTSFGEHVTEHGDEKRQQAVTALISIAALLLLLWGIGGFILLVLAVH